MDLESSRTMSHKEIILKGIPGSPGLCIGKAYLVDKEGVDVVEKYYIGDSDLEAEINRFKAAVKKAIDELAIIIEDTPDEFRQHTHILETHKVLLQDKMLYDRTINIIKNERVNAEWALKKTISIVRPMFETMDNDYLKDRAEDIIHVSDRVLNSLVGAEGVNIAKIDKRVVLVAPDLSPAETSQIQLERVMGFVTDHGGRASHTSIIARTLEIPAVLGLEHAMHTIKNDDIIIVDGSAGIVVVHPSDHTLIDAEDRKARYENFKAVIARWSHLPAETSDGFRLKMMGNIELPEEVVAVRDRGGEGIGLYRTEFQYLNRMDFPAEETLYENYKDVIDVIPEHPVTIRTLDINGDKAVAYISPEDEDNPALGLRAIRYCLQRPEIFKTQLRAILRAAVHGDVRILFPMIASLEEVREAKRHFNQAAECLDKEGVPFKADIPIGVMIEVPSAVITADHIAKEVDFFSIGTNDLIQYTLAIDRGNRHVAHMYQALHPAILRLLKQLTDVGREAGIPTYMCGEMAGDPRMMPILLGLGLDELSMNPQAIPAAKRMVRALNLAESQEFLETALKMRTVTAIESLLEDSYGEALAAALYTPNGWD
jgi:phosphoenolpyruvate-protein phosphotransferase (PTS system enzyme I)